MIDYYEPVDFSATVFTIDGAAIRAHVLADLVRQHCKETTTPLGIAPDFHTRENELWSWGRCGQSLHRVATFATPVEAEHALLVSFLYDAQNSPDLWIYYSLEQAVADLEDIEND